jgi:hypothetical protein
MRVMDELSRREQEVHMKRTFLMATLGGLLALGAISGTTVAAQSPAPAKVEKEKPAADTAAKPAKKATHKAAMAADQKSDLQVKQQPTGPEPSSQTPTGELALGTVKLTKKVTADGKPLAAGTYQVRLTAQEAESKAQGATASYERWVEFLQGGQVKGREVVSIVPAADASKVAKEPAPAPGRAKVEQLKGDDYLRVWINKGGNHYLIHLVTAA